MGNAGVTFLSVLNIILDGVLAGLLFIYTDSIWLSGRPITALGTMYRKSPWFQVSGTGADNPRLQAWDLVLIG